MSGKVYDINLTCDFKKKGLKVLEIWYSNIKILREGVKIIVLIANHAFFGMTKTHQLKPALKNVQ